MAPIITIFILFSFFTVPLYSLIRPVSILYRTDTMSFCFTLQRGGGESKTETVFPCFVPLARFLLRLKALAIVRTSVYLPTNGKKTKLDISHAGRNTLIQLPAALTIRLQQFLFGCNTISGHVMTHNSAKITGVGPGIENPP